MVFNQSKQMCLLSSKRVLLNNEVMKKRFILAVSLLFSLLSVSAHAEGTLPAGEVSCSLTDSGVYYGVSMGFSAGNVSIGALTYDWEFSLLSPGANPALVSNYSPRQLFRSTGEMVWACHTANCSI